LSATRKTRAVTFGRAALLLGLLAVAFARQRPAVAEPPGGGAYRIIVHPSNSSTSIDRRFLSQAFLKKVTIWPSGETIRPVDQHRDSAIRARFTDEILARSISAVRSYWQQMIFAGRGVPPPEMTSDDDVVRFVMRQPGGIGYVSFGADLHGARILTVE
jgi:ABC-type phosphate transport system substrate-binding protein